MKEGTITESGYYFPADKIGTYLKGLMDTNYFEDIQFINFPTENRILLMTHDDIFDQQMYEIEHDVGITSTWFLDISKEQGEIPKDADIQLHFNKELPYTLEEQIRIFKEKFGKTPVCNRNHRLLWKSNNFDFPFLAMNGIAVDMTLIGTRPYIPVINGKVIPILELPFCISDTPQRPMALYNVAKNIMIPFRQGLPVITVLAHPLEICEQYHMKSCFKEVLAIAKHYGYSIGSVDQYRKGIKRGSLPYSISSDEITASQEDD